LAICEATHLEHHEDMGIPHSSARQAGDSARRAGVGALVITHLPPGSNTSAHMEEASDSFGRPVQLASPGTTFEI